jgi:hypothetical protein
LEQGLRGILPKVDFEEKAQTFGSFFGFYFLFLMKDCEYLKNFNFDPSM